MSDSEDHVEIPYFIITAMCAPEWLCTWSSWVDFLACGRKLTGKSFSRSLTNTKPKATATTKNHSLVDLPHIKQPSMQTSSSCWHIFVDIVPWTFFCVLFVCVLNFTKFRSWTIMEVSVEFYFQWPRIWRCWHDLSVYIYKACRLVFSCRCHLIFSENRWPTKPEN